MSPDEKQRDAANACVRRWEDRALALKARQDAAEYEQEKAELFREMLLAYADLKHVPNRPHTIINYMAATYLDRGENPVITFRKFCKMCEYALAGVRDTAERARKVAAAAAAKTDGEGGSKGSEDDGAGREPGKTVSKPTPFRLEADLFGAQNPKTKPDTIGGPSKTATKASVPERSATSAPEPKPPTKVTGKGKQRQQDVDDIKPKGKQKEPSRAAPKSKNDELDDEVGPPIKGGGKKHAVKAAAASTVQAAPSFLKSKPKPPKEKAPGGKDGILPEPKPKPKMVAMAVSKWPRRDPTTADEESSESEEEQPKVAEVRPGGPSGKVVRVVLTSRKGSKKTPTRKAKQVKSQELVPTTDEESSPSGTEYEGEPQEKRARGSEPAPLHKAQSRAKSRAKSEAVPPSERSRKKARVREIPPLPDFYITVATKCTPCERRSEGCHFETGPSGYVAAKVCHHCAARKVKCFFENPDLAPAGMGGELHAEPSAPLPSPPQGFAADPRRRVLVAPTAPFSFLEANLGDRAERLRVVKSEEAPAPGIAGEEDAAPLTTVGDLFVHLVELVRQLKDENTELRRDMQGLGTQVLAWDARQAQCHQATLAAIRALSRDRDDLSLNNDLVASTSTEVAGPSGSNRPSTTPKPNAADEPPKPAEEAAPGDEPKTTEEGPKDAEPGEVQALGEIARPPSNVPESVPEAVPAVAEAPESLPPNVDPSLVMDDADGSSEHEADADAHGEDDDDDQRSPPPPPGAEDDAEMHQHAVSPMPSSGEEEAAGSVSQAEALPKRPKRSRGKKAQDLAAADAVGAEPEPPKKRRKVDDKQDAEGPEESPKKRGRLPAAGKAKGGAAAARRGATGPK